MARSKLPILGSYLRPHWKAALTGVLSLLVVNLLGISIPLVLRNGVDKLQANFSYGDVVRYSLIIMALASGMWVVRMVSRISLFGVGRQVEFDLKQRIFNHLLTMEPAYFVTNTPGDLISRATSDVDNVRRLLGFAVLSLVNTIFAYAFTLPVMLSISVQLTLASLAIYPAMFFLVHLFSDRLRQQQLDVQQRTSNLSDLIQEDISGMALIKIYAQEENEREAFRERNQSLLEGNLTLARTRTTLFPLLGGMASVSLLVVLWFGSGAIADGRLSVGDFIALLLYVERLVFPTALLGFTITAYQRGEVSIDRVEFILQEEPKVQDAPNAVRLNPQDVRGWVSAHHLTFSYPDSRTPALQDVEFTLKPGETVALVGPIGSGKSTLANALPRLLDVAPGQLFVDGYDITQIRLRDLRSAIAYVPQESFLFSTTIKNNVRYGDPRAEQDEVELAAKQAQIHPEILNFPQQYKTIVGERGITLSGGQRQRTALSRALLVDAPILILDDALSSVDNQTATQILQNLKTGTQRKTVLFITHQMAAAAIADRILVMDQGRIVQQGTHDELLAQGGLYQVLWEQHTLEQVLQ
ncbi:MULTISPECIES: ABC transporter ATP-binding protein [unclassified Leptolyngbya]|uniref:ABC transporter ATP-binding protein n=1 Tax=unclassified Leptolyngbya TaxID=2650499 RepID=UPI0016857863|nr:MULTISPECIES: ABC transporter ATP-binding protein [unclassified Leptolyngbya]MBD1910049.1 ABC transporter ATP-binding protein [Leptolyngbya sp. FACHB-8]MBD2153066.1 ABC transporter ATP-binding protein [Leptolyngbya sp. FACHB-16]